MVDRTFNTDEPLAYFITWTTYGTWLPGDSRGWWQRGDGELHSPNELFREMAVSAMKETAFKLDLDQRRVERQSAGAK